MVPTRSFKPEAVVSLSDDHLTVADVVHKGRRVLVVENDEADAKVIAACLEVANAVKFKVTYVDGLKTAIVHLSRAEVDCVLLDLALPGSAGLDGLTAVLRTCDVPVVVMTGSNDPAVGEAAVGMGAQDFLFKTEVTPVVLQRAILYAMERHAHQAALRRANATLFEARARFQRAFDSAPIGMALVGLDASFMELNPALVEMVGYDGLDLLAMGARGLVHVDDLEDFDGAFSRLSRGELRSFRAEYVLVARGDRRICALVAAAIVDDASHRPAYVILQVEDITARKDAEARLVHQALHDPLTGLPNRLLFRDRFEHALARLGRSPGWAGVFYVDLDEFKVVNDTLGHERGDELLAEVGRRLTSVVRPSDTVARIGGDEFVVLAEGLSGRDEVCAMAARILVAVSAPARLADVEMVPSVSVGVALATERHRVPAQLLREADTAMYRAKDLGKGRFQMFDALGGGLSARALSGAATGTGGAGFYLG